jgi:hypothetical protein
MELVSQTWYVKNTCEQVLVTKVDCSWYDHSNEIKYTVEVEFLNAEPCERALSVAGAQRIIMDLHHSYQGHPVQQEQYQWVATLNVKDLSNVPYGTKAAEVLFGKK